MTTQQKKIKTLEQQVLWDMAERCAGVAKGEKMGRWTHEDRVLVVYSLLCSLLRISAKKIDTPVRSARKKK